MHCGVELEYRVAVVIGLRRIVDRAVSGRHPDVAACVDDGRRPAHPHGALIVATARIDLEVVRLATAFRNCGDPSVVVGTVTVVASEPDDHLSVVEGEARALQLVEGQRAWRINCLIHLYGTRG